MRSRPGPLVTLAVVGALACASCGSARHVNVIREWARALTAGDINKASSYFALPAIVQNGTPPVRITSRTQVREFNELLPCGARLVMSARHGAYIYATFRLTDRVGGDCGPGIGATAATAFLLRDGKIAEWRRLPTPPSIPAPPPGSGQNPSV
jgi:hypothetical protein